MGTMAGTSGRLYKEGAVPLQEVGDLREAMALMRTALSTMPASLSSADTDPLVKTYNEELAIVRARAASLSRGATGPFEQALTRFEAGLDGYTRIAQDQLIPLARQHRVAAWWVAQATVLPFADEMTGGLGTLTKLEVAKSNQLGKEAKSTASSSRAIVLVLELIVAGAGVAIGSALSRMIVKPLRRAVAVLHNVADGDLTCRVGISTQDEFGEMSAAVDKLAAGLQSAVGSLTEQSAVLVASSEALAVTTTQISANAEKTSVQSVTMSDVADQINTNVTSLAASAEEMTSTVGEIARSAARAAEMANNGAHSAVGADAIVRELVGAASQIGDVARLITAIADQTKLLALNATIEAARAGEAGKGFAIVANEVKDLAQQTSQATADIDHRIEAIQMSADKVATAMAGVSQIIAEINDAQTTIAAAVEQQSAMAAEIGRRIGEVAYSNQEVVSSISGVTEATAQTARGTSQSMEAVRELTGVASKLQDLVGGFRS
jgi:methyl-accepting chemotaxis protein